MKYFKMLHPQTPLYLTNGLAVHFDSIDGKVGYKAVADQGLIDQIELAIKNEVGGVTVATEQEYRDFEKKKQATPSYRHWREEWGKSLVRPAALGKTSPPQEKKEVAPPAVDKPTPKMPAPNFVRPNSTKR